MIYTADEIRTLVLKTTNTEEYGADYDTLIPIWTKGLLAAGRDNDVFVLWVKRYMLQFTQAQLRKKYNSTRGNDRADIKAQFDNITVLLKDVLAEIEIADPLNGVPVLGIGSLHANTPDAIEEARLWMFPNGYNRIGGKYGR